MYFRRIQQEFNFQEFENKCPEYSEENVHLLDLSTHMVDLILTSTPYWENTTLYKIKHYPTFIKTNIVEDIITHQWTVKYKFCKLSRFFLFWWLIYFNLAADFNSTAIFIHLLVQENFELHTHRSLRQRASFVTR